jgi:hypothetical protein
MPHAAVAAIGVSLGQAFPIDFFQNLLARFNFKAQNNKQRSMEKKDLYNLTDEELLVEKKKLMKSKIWYATAIGFLAGILIFGVVSWSLSSEKSFGFLIPMSIPVIFIYRMLKAPNKNKDLEDVLKERKLE